MLRTYLLIIAMVFVLPVAMPFPAMADGNDDARHFVDDVGKHVLSVINTPKISEDQKQKQLRQLFTENVDISWMGQFVLGHAWQQASEEERNRYLQAYQQYLLAHYTTNFTDYSGSKYKITDVKSDVDGRYSVNMEINTPGEKEGVLAGYRLHVDSKGQFRIIDIIIEGVSLITTERSEFSSIAQRGGLDALIKDLQSKSQEESKKS